MAVQQQAAGYSVWRLRQQVQLTCGPATKFGPIERQLAEWVESGAHASRATRETVEPSLAGYLHQARAAGMRWGMRVGLISGVSVALVAFAVTLVVR